MVTVDRYITERGATSDREPRRDHEVWREVMTVLRRHGVLGRLQSRTLKGKHYEEQFEAALRNGVWNVAKPLSLDDAAHALGRARARDPGFDDTWEALRETEYRAALGLGVLGWALAAPGGDLHDEEREWLEAQRDDPRLREL